MLKNTFGVESIPKNNYHAEDDEDEYELGLSNGEPNPFKAFCSDDGFFEVRD